MAVRTARKLCLPPTAAPSASASDYVMRLRSQVRRRLTLCPFAQAAELCWSQVTGQGAVGSERTNVNTPASVSVRGGVPGSAGSVMDKSSRKR